MDSPLQPGPSSATSSTSPNSPSVPDHEGKNWNSKIEDEEDENNGEGDTELSLNQSATESSTSASNEIVPANEAFSMGQVASQIEDLIKEVQDIIPQPSENIRWLLNHFDWNKERLLDAYFEVDNIDKLFADVEARIKTPSASGGESSKSTPSSSADERGKLPLLQKESVPAYEIFSLEQVASQMVDVIKEVRSIIPQPFETIRLLLNHFDWNKELLHDAYFDNAEKLLAEVETTENPSASGGESSKSTIFSSLADKYGKSRMKSFVESNPNLKWCPNPFCTRAIKVRRVNQKDSYIKCDCGNSFCFLCEAYAHVPVSCDLFRKWTTKFERLLSQEPRSTDLTRFQLYLGCYNDQEKLLEEERKLYDKLVLYETQEATLPFAKIPFLKDTVDTVCQCRLAVMHTYVLEYYYHHNLTDRFFTVRKHLQEDMERLSEFLRGITNLHTLFEVKFQVENLCTLGQSRRLVLIDYVHEGCSKREEDGGWTLSEE